MKTLSIVALCTWAGLGCQTSPVPLAAPSEFEFRPELLGAWESRDDATPDTLFVIGFNSGEYYVELHTQLEGPVTWRARAFITRVAGADFMNVQELGMKPTGYLFYRFALAGDTLAVTTLKHWPDTVKTSEHARSLITESLASDTMYEDAARYVRLRMED
jgi:hypothetical protein